MDDAERESNINLDQSVGVKRFFILKMTFKHQLVERREGIFYIKNFFLYFLNTLDFV